MSLKLTDLMGDEGFDVLKFIASEDPEELERLLRVAITDFIASVPEERRESLEALQVDIDLMRFEITDPLDRCQAIIRLVAKNRNMLLEKWQELKNILEQGKAAAKPNVKTDSYILNIDFNDNDNKQKK